MSRCQILSLILFLVGNSLALAQQQPVLLPAEHTLASPAASQRLILQVRDGERFLHQLSDNITWVSSNEDVATVSDTGVVSPVTNGTAIITASRGDQTATSNVTVSGVDQPHTKSFRHDVLPVLSKAGCNMGSCHGALAGKGGFRLSLRGYDPPTDFFNIVQQDRGRRVEFDDPGRSLLLAKPSGGIPHKGGVRFDVDSPQYRILAEWIQQGATAPADEDRRVESLTITPDRSIHKLGEQQQMLVSAHFSDGSVRDVTPWTKWSSSNEAVAAVNEQGEVEVIGAGEGAIVAWYSSKLAIARITVPYTVEGAQPHATNRLEPRNFIDEQIDKQLDLLNLTSSPRCGDSEFIRRAYVDTIGTIPTSAEVQTFLEDPSPEKRDKLIDTLLARPEFVDYWSYKWGDILMLNGTLLRPEALKSYYMWMRGHVEQNTPWDAVVREVMTATGNSHIEGATNFYALNQTPEEMTENACQAFLGLSIGCAKCHNHPLEKWTNDQYYAMANLFSRVKAKGWGGEPRNGDGLRTLYVATAGDLVQPRTGKPQPPTPLDGTPLNIDDPGDRRIALAHWMTSPDNPYFARSITNRIWANYFGVGLIEGVDDLRVSNPASNEELLSAAAKHLIDNKFNLKELMKVILQSNAYQRSSQPLHGNEKESRFYSRYYPRRMMAEVLHDAIAQVTQVPTTFDQVAFPGADKQKTEFYPVGTRAIQLYDSAVENYFLKAFGRNDRNIVCECERSDEPSMVQVLHISNGNTLNNKLQTKDNRVDKLLKLRAAGMSNAALLDEVYLTTLARFPTQPERTQLLESLPQPGSEDERIITEDILWAILSSREFLFNH